MSYSVKFGLLPATSLQNANLRKNFGRNTLSVNRFGVLRGTSLSREGGKERVGFRERRTEEIRIYGHNLVYCLLAVLLMQNCRK